MMKQAMRRHSPVRRGLAAALSLGLLAGVSGCGTDAVRVPELDGPSSNGYYLKLTTDKDILLADGRDSAVIAATVIGPNGEPAANRSVFFAITDQNGRYVDLGAFHGINGLGTGATTSTNSQGVASVVYEAPPRTDANTQRINIVARLVGNDFNGDVYQSVTIELRAAEPRLFPQNPDNKKPTCSFTYEAPSGIKRGVQILFQSTSADSDGQIIRYDWNFNDNTRHFDTPDTNHSWAVDPPYVITHTVTDNEGAQASCSMTCVATGTCTLATTGP